jgi:hypothetical protein
MDCKLGDWGSIPNMMGYFPFAMMFFLAVVFTQHHYNSKAGRRKAEYAHLMPRYIHVMVLRNRDSLCLLFLVMLSLCL